MTDNNNTTYPTRPISRWALILAGKVSPADRAAMKLYDRSIMLPAAKYRLLKDVGR